MVANDTTLNNTESGDYHKQFYYSLLGEMIYVLEDVALCDGCKFCAR
jgi:hypothetical protein